MTVMVMFNQCHHRHSHRDDGDEDGDEGGDHTVIARMMLAMAMV